MNRWDWTEGVGMAMLLVLPYSYRFLLNGNMALYHLHLPVAHRLGGLLLDCLFYTLLVGVFLNLLRLLPEFSRRLVDAFYAAIAVWLAVDFAFLLARNWLDAYRIGKIAVAWNYFALALPPLAMVLAWRWEAKTHVVVRVVRLAVTGLAFSAIWIIPQLMRVALAHPHTEAAVPLESGTNRQHPRRIVWILFDELSYKQVFDHPYPGIETRHFDQLRSESVSFNRLQPDGFFTDIILPSLFLGQHIERIRSGLDGQLFYWDKSKLQWRAYDTLETLFGLARQRGWSTAISGWYNPYCRLFGALTTACFWEANQIPMESFGASEALSQLQNAALLSNRLLEPYRGHTTPAEDHIRICSSVLNQARLMIADDRQQFIFVHIPVPHAPATYDRRTHTAREGGTYLDSVVEADDMLGAIQSWIVASPQGAQTTLIVSSDHSWRIHTDNVGRRSKDESEEEWRASGGRFDDRPVLLIHFPGQQSSDEVSDPVAEMTEHNMLAAMLEDRMQRVEDFDSFRAGRLH